MKLASLTAALLLAATRVAFAEGDAARGEKRFEECVACHALEKDKDFVEDFKKITGDDPELVPAEEVERIFARIRNVDPVVKQVLRDSVGAEQ